MHRLSKWIIFALPTSLLAGCDARPSKDQLGTVVFELPKESAKPVELPFLDTAAMPRGHNEH
jgi:hypothetical protein